jgi:hypothetical protein
MLKSSDKLKKCNNTNYTNFPLLPKRESNLKKNKNNSLKKVIFKTIKNNNNTNCLLNTSSLTNNETTLTKYNSQSNININLLEPPKPNINNTSSTNIDNFNNNNINFNRTILKKPIPKLNIFNKNTKKNEKIQFLSKIYKISKINRNVSSDNMYINEAISKNKSAKIIIPKIYKKNSKEVKLLPFLEKSRKKKISAKDIYLHYLKENENDKSKSQTIYNFSKYLQNNNKKFNYGFDKIYGNNPSFMGRINEIKKNNFIAYKKDFNIQDYQNTLLKLLKKKVSPKYLENLESSYKLFNERNFGMTIPRGRYIDLANKLKNFLSKDIFEKVKRMDKNYLIYLEKKEEEIINKNMEEINLRNFNKHMNRTLMTFRKSRENRSV